MIDPDAVNIVREELEKGVKPEDITEKLRDAGFTDDEVEQILSKAQNSQVYIIKRPSRPTIFKTMLSKRTLVLIMFLVGVVAVMLYFSGWFVKSSGSIEDRAKQLADATQEAQLFFKATELQNRVIGCIEPNYNATLMELMDCVVVASKRIDKLTASNYAVTYSVTESPLCRHQYIFSNDLLKISVDMNTAKASANWIGKLPFNEEAVNALYPGTDCTYLAQYTDQWIAHVLNVSG